MDCHQAGSLKYYTFSSLREYPNLFHTVLSRHGGYSDSPWSSLNLGGSVGDDPERVRKNLRKAFVTFNRHPEMYADAWLVHGTDVYFATEPQNNFTSPPKADIILSDRRELILFLRFADCVPVILFDPQNNVVGLVHSGWRGTVKKASKIAVEVMAKKYGSRPENIMACIGPSIGPDHYEVGLDVVEQVRASFQNSADSVLQDWNGSFHFDLWTANEVLLSEAGVRHIERSDVCTACRTDDFFSHRAENGKTGRFGVMVGLKE